MSDTTTTVRQRICLRCFQPDKTFRSEKAARCTDCDAEAAADRKAWARNYHAARSRAVSRLVKRHHPEFKAYLDEELDRA